MIKRPMTARERLKRDLNIAASEALYRYMWPTEIRGMSRHPCPGKTPFFPNKPCTSPGAHDGSYRCGADHYYFHTNHGQS